MFEEIIKLLDKPVIAAILGVIIGLLGGEVVRSVREILTERKLLYSLKEELKSNFFLIRQKQRMVKSIVNYLKDGKLLPGVSAQTMTIIYDNYYATISKKLNALERDNIHIIYEHLISADKFLNSYEERLVNELGLSNLSMNEILSPERHKEFIRKDIQKGKVIKKYIAHLNDINENYELNKGLIYNFLNKKLKDVLHRNKYEDLPMNSYLIVYKDSKEEDTLRALHYESFEEAKSAEVRVKAQLLSEGWSESEIYLRLLTLDEEQTAIFS